MSNKHQQEREELITDLQGIFTAGEGRRVDVVVGAITDFILARDAKREGEAIGEASKWIKYHANDEKYLKPYMTTGKLHIDSNQLAWDLKGALTNQQAKGEE